jgi:hypothetical protein
LSPATIIKVTISQLAQPDKLVSPAPISPGLIVHKRFMPVKHTPDRKGEIVMTAERTVSGAIMLDPTSAERGTITTFTPTRTEIIRLKRNNKHTMQKEGINIGL